MVLLDFGAVINTFKPRNATELKKLDELFNQLNHTFERYVENLKLGVLTGYVRPKEACHGGLHNFHYTVYRNIALENEAGEGVFRVDECSRQSRMGGEGRGVAKFLKARPHPI